MPDAGLLLPFVLPEAFGGPEIQEAGLPIQVTTIPIPSYNKMQ